ncbi:MAG: hypothetical protein ABIU11_02020 [Chitinophagaceae bacterium]
MIQNNNIIQELKELKSSLSGLSTQNIYSVPDGYFDSLPGNLLNRIKAMEAVNTAEELRYLSPLLSNVSKQMPYAVPTGYFNGLEEKLMQVVRESSDYQTVKEELETISPLLSGLKKQMPASTVHSGWPYSVPQRYFENLAAPVNKESTISEVKVVSITQRKWFRLAAAAVITGIIAMAAFIFINKDKVDPGTNSYGWVKKNTKKVSTENLSTFVELSEEEDLVASTDTKTPQEVKELIKDVPENEIQSLLNDTQLLDETNTEITSDDEILMN